MSEMTNETVSYLHGTSPGCIRRLTRHHHSIVCRQSHVGPAPNTIGDSRACRPVHTVRSVCLLYMEPSCSSDFEMASCWTWRTARHEIEKAVSSTPGIWNWTSVTSVSVTNLRVTSAISSSNAKAILASVNGTGCVALTRLKGYTNAAGFSAFTPMIPMSPLAIHWSRSPPSGYAFALNWRKWWRIAAWIIFHLVTPALGRGAITRSLHTANGALGGRHWVCWAFLVRLVAIQLWTDVPIDAVTWCLAEDEATLGVCIVNLGLEFELWKKWNSLLPLLESPSFESSVLQVLADGSTDMNRHQNRESLWWICDCNWTTWKDKHPS